MSDKKWIVDFKLPQLAASHYYQSVEVSAANVGLALNRAWATIKTRPAVKGRRVKEAQVSIRIAGE